MKDILIEVAETIFKKLLNNNTYALYSTIILIVLALVYITIRNKKNKNETVEACKSAQKILITGACGNIGYSLSFMIAQGRLLGLKQKVILHLFDLPHMESALEGVKMEIIDGAFELVEDIIVSTNIEIAFKDIDYAVMCGAKPRLQGMERKDLLTQNKNIFEEQGKALNKFAKKTVKVCVIGNPANTNCLVLLKNAPSINPNNFTALTRLDHNRMLAQIGIKLNITNYDKIKNCSIFGNHSSTQFPNIDFASYNNKSLRELINDDNWVNKNFIEIIQKRGAEILDKRKMSSVASAASAACDHMRNWILGSENSWVSMGVYSRGEYGAPKDVIFSFPVICKDGEWKIVENLKLSEFAKEKIKVTGDELIGEKNLAFE